MATSGYVYCSCRTCFDITVSSTGESELCSICSDSGCDATGRSDCTQDETGEQED